MTNSCCTCCVTGASDASCTSSVLLSTLDGASAGLGRMRPCQPTCLQARRPPHVPGGGRLVACRPELLPIPLSHVELLHACSSARQAGLSLLKAGGVFKQWHAGNSVLPGHCLQPLGHVIEDLLRREGRKGSHAVQRVETVQLQLCVGLDSLAPCRPYRTSFNAHFTPVAPYRLPTQIWALKALQLIRVAAA